MTRQSEQIQLNIEILDIDGICKALTALGIKWKFREGNKQVERFPNKKDIINVATRCMQQAFDSPSNRCEMGGFEAEVKGGMVEIRYILSRANPLSKLFG
jgi:hypothetical protein